MTGEPKVELFLLGGWTDITEYVKVENRISIRRGRADESAGPTPATCTLTLKNNDGRFSPRNASGIYFGQIGRNTQLRVSVRTDAGAYSVRFVGEVSEWPVTWDPTGTVVDAQVTASGIRRRLSAGQPVFRSAAYRVYTTRTGLVAYWPFEGASTGTYGAAGPAATPATATVANGGVVPADDETWVASDPLPVITDLGSITALVPPYNPVAAGVYVRWFWRGQSTVPGADSVITIFTNLAHYFVLAYDATTDQISFVMRSLTDGHAEFTSVLGAGGQINQGRLMEAKFVQSGTSIIVTVSFLAPGGSSTFSYTPPMTITSATLANISAVTVNNTGTGMETVFGHLEIENVVAGSFADFKNMSDAYAGETASARAFRVADETNLTGAPNVMFYLGTGVTPVTPFMGVQPEGTFLSLWDQAIQTDDGISTEEVDTLALSFITRESMFDQSATMTLAYTDVTTMTPVDDDQLLENSVTVTRIGGAQSTQALTTGRLGIPTVGEYDGSYDLSLFTDSQASDLAGILLAEHTVDIPRVPDLGFDLMTLTGAQRTQWLAVREGKRIAVQGSPAFTGVASTQDYRVMGWAEIIDVNQWLVDVQLIPNSPYDNVFILNSTTYGVLNVDRLA